MIRLHGGPEIEVVTEAQAYGIPVSGRWAVQELEVVHSLAAVPRFGANRIDQLDTGHQLEMRVVQMESDPTPHHRLNRDRLAELIRPAEPGAREALCGLYALEEMLPPEKEPIVEVTGGMGGPMFRVRVVPRDSQGAS